MPIFQGRGDATVKIPVKIIVSQILTPAVTLPHMAGQKEAIILLKCAHVPQTADGKTITADAVFTEKMEHAMMIRTGLKNMPECAGKTLRNAVPDRRNRGHMLPLTLPLQEAAATMEI